MGGVTPMHSQYWILQILLHVGNLLALVMPTQMTLKDQMALTTLQQLLDGVKAISDIITNLENGDNQTLHAALSLITVATIAGQRYTYSQLCSLLQAVICISEIAASREDENSENDNKITDLLLSLCFTDSLLGTVTSVLLRFDLCLGIHTHSGQLSATYQLVEMILQCVRSTRASLKPILNRVAWTVVVTFQERHGLSYFYSLMLGDRAFVTYTRYLFECLKGISPFPEHLTHATLSSLLHCIQENCLELRQDPAPAVGPASDEVTLAPHALIVMVLWRMLGSIKGLVKFQCTLQGTCMGPRPGPQQRARGSSDDVRVCRGIRKGTGNPPTTDVLKKWLWYSFNEMQRRTCVNDKLVLVRDSVQALACTYTNTLNECFEDVYMKMTAVVAYCFSTKESTRVMVKCMQDLVGALGKLLQAFDHHIYKVDTDPRVQVADSNRALGQFNVYILGVGKMVSSYIAQFVMFDLDDWSQSNCDLRLLMCKLGYDAMAAIGKLECHPFADMLKTNINTYIEDARRVSPDTFHGMKLSFVREHNEQSRNATTQVQALIKFWGVQRMTKFNTLAQKTQKNKILRLYRELVDLLLSLHSVEASQQSGFVQAEAKGVNVGRKEAYIMLKRLYYNIFVNGLNKTYTHVNHECRQAHPGLAFLTVPGVTEYVIACDILFRNVIGMYAIVTTFK